MIEYRLANSKDMSQLAKVHKECFPDSITAVLFNSLRTKYLMGYLQNGCIALLAEDDHKIIGFCLANQGEDTLFYSTIRSNIGVFIANILIQLLKANKILWSKLWDKIRFTKIHSKKRGGGDSYKKLMDHSDQRSAIWYIAVTESYRGKGIAQELLRIYEELLMERGIDRYGLSTRVQNHRAQSFYKKCGLVEIRRTSTLVSYQKFLNK